MLARFTEFFKSLIFTPVAPVASPRRTILINLPGGAVQVWQVTQ